MILNSVSPPPASRMDEGTALQSVRALSLREVRARIRPECLQRSAPRALAWLGVDLLLYATCIAGVVLADALWLKLMAGLFAGCSVAFLFVWAHDAAHGALFSSRRWSEVLGTIAMLPSLNVYRLWAFGHNRVHHGFTSMSAIDWIWRPWTPEEYAASSPWQRLLYRMERSAPGCALHYLRRVWWQGMVRFNPGQTPEERARMRRGKQLVMVFALAAGAAAYAFAGGIAGVISAVILPFIVFNYFIALFVYLHHTHPDIPFFRDREAWSPAVGQLYCSTIVRMSRPMEKLTHNIMIHVPHHVHPLIPFFHLPQAYADLKQHYGRYIHEYRFSWRRVLAIFRQCKLFDYEQRRWYDFDAALQRPRPAAAA